MRCFAAVVAFVTVFSGIVLVGVPAFPCTIDGCRYGELNVVHRQIVVPGFSLPGPRSEATVPANIPAILWRLNEDAYIIQDYMPDPADVLLSTLNVAAHSAFSFYEGMIPEQVDFLDRRTFVLVPDTPLEPDRSYLIADMGVRIEGCGMPDSGRFETSPSAAMPTDLGTLELPTTVRRYVSSSSVDYVSFDVANPAWMDLEIEDAAACTIYIGAAMAFVKFTPSQGALPWKDAFYYRLFVDNKPWIYHPLTPMDIHDVLGQDATWSTIFAYCGAPVDRCHKWYPLLSDSAEEWQEQFEDMKNRGIYDVLDPGIHRVRLQAWLPGTDLVLQTPEIEIDIQCPERIEEECPVVDTDATGDRDAVGDVQPEDVHFPKDATCDSPSCFATDGGCQAGGGTGETGGFPMAAVILLAGIAFVAGARFTESRRSLRQQDGNDGRLQMKLGCCSGLHFLDAAEGIREKPHDPSQCRTRNVCCKGRRLKFRESETCI